MPAENKFLNLSRDQLRDIGLGIGRGFQAYDPNNPFASAGAALEATLASGMTRDMRAEDRQQRLEDLDRAERALLERERRAESSMLERESRAEKSMIAREGRLEESYDRKRKADIESELDVEEIIYNRNKKRKDEEEADAKKERGVFRSVGLGLKQEPVKVNDEWKKNWFSTLGKYVKKTSGSSPVDVYDIKDVNF